MPISVSKNWKNVSFFRLRLFLTNCDTQCDLLKGIDLVWRTYLRIQIITSSKLEFIFCIERKIFIEKILISNQLFEADFEAILSLRSHTNFKIDSWFFFKVNEILMRPTQTHPWVIRKHHKKFEGLKTRSWIYILFLGLALWSWLVFFK